jgi:5-methylcytosine-specific restriction endonuclease McrA
VIHRFHTIGNNKDLAKDCFYEFHFGKKIILKEAFLDLTENHYDELVGEANDRWDQLERGFEINHTHGKWQLANDLRNIYLKDGYDRKSLKPNIKFLEAYQCNTCFYCGEELDPKKIEVDHVLPRQVIQHDEIWNLVLAHDHCNSQKSDKIVGPNFIEKLIHRNENIMGSNHPWKSKIESQLGKNKKARSSKLRKHYENTKTVKGSDYWNGNSNYDPSKDRFYRRIVTILCNK